MKQFAEGTATAATECCGRRVFAAAGNDLRCGWGTIDAVLTSEGDRLGLASSGNDSVDGGLGTGMQRGTRVRIALNEERCGRNCEVAGHSQHHPIIRSC